MTITGKKISLVLFLALEWIYLENKESNTSNLDNCMAPRLKKQGRRATSIGCNCWALLAIKSSKSCKDLLIKSLNHGKILSEHVRTDLDLLPYFMGNYSTDRFLDSDKSTILYHNICSWEAKEVWYLQKHGRIGFPFREPVHELPNSGRISWLDTLASDILPHARLEMTWGPLLSHWDSWYFLPGIHLPINWISPKPFSVSTSLNPGVRRLAPFLSADQQLQRRS